MKISWKEIESGLHLEGEASTLEAGQWIGQSIAKNQTITLSGNLGNGKTTLAKGIAAGWGVSGTVKSPTYNYFLTYRGERGLLVHLDAYRLSHAEEYDSLLLEDILEEPWLLLVEWPEKIASCLPRPLVALRMEFFGESARRLSL